jgi:phage-related protein
MQFTINGFTIGGDSTSYYLQSPITGLEKPRIRTSSNDYSGRDGGYVSSQYYTSREIVINGFYKGKNCEEADGARASLTNAFPIRELMPMFITTFSGKKYFTEVVLRDMKSEITGPLAGVFQLTFIAPDPYLYDPGDGINPETGITSATFYKIIPGGYITPYELPVTWVPGTQSTPITNSGDIDVKPTITLKGTFTNPTVRNLTTNEYLTLNITTTATDTIVINMKDRTITLNGGSIASSRTIDSRWWTLQKGLNRIVLETTASGDTNFATISWRGGHEGI